MFVFRRIQELYQRGGFREIARGIRDFIMFKTNAESVFLKLTQSATLNIGDVNIEFYLEQKEDFARASGHGERDVLLDFIDELSANDTVWDIGANIGTYSIAAELLDATAEAFEPATGAQERLNRNASLNGVSIDIHDYALADENGKTILSHEDRSGTRQLTDSGAGDVVPVKRGDDVDIIPPDIVKIDVEGAEIDVLRGMHDTLAKSRVCYVEYHSNVDRSAVMNEVKETGLEFAFEFNRNILKFTREFTKQPLENNSE